MSTVTSTHPTSIVVSGLGKQRLAALATKAKQLGMSPARYVRQLVEDDLALDREAREKSIAEIMGPGREVDEVELDALVDAARTRHHRSRAGKR